MSFCSHWLISNHGPLAGCYQKEREEGSEEQEQAQQELDTKHINIQTEKNNNCQAVILIHGKNLM